MNRRFGLHLKIILIATFIICLMSAVTAWSLSAMNRRITQETQFATFQQQTRTLAIGLEHVLLIGDAQQIQKVLDFSVKEKDPVFSFLITDSGEAFFSAAEDVDSELQDFFKEQVLKSPGNGREGHLSLETQKFGRIYSFKAPVMTSRNELSEVGLFGVDVLGTEKIGEVGILFSTLEIDSKIRRANLFIFMILSYVAVFIILLVLLISRRLVKNLQLLTQALERVSKGDLQAMVLIETRDEVQDLAHGFNHMVQRLQKTTVSRDKLLAEIREREKAEYARASTEVNLSNIIEANIDAILVLNADREIQLANPKACELLKRKPQDLAGIKFPFDFEVNLTQEIVLDPENRDAAKIAELHVLKTVWNGGAAFLVSMRDVTERVILENQLRHSQKMEAIGKLAGGVAHDFNNLLSIIGGYAELLLDRYKDDEETVADVTEIRMSVDRASALTRQLLAFSRRQIMNPKVVNINQTLETVDEMLKRLIGSDIDLKVDKARDLKNTIIDPGGLEQVLVNLVVNARDAMEPRGGKIVITTENLSVLETKAPRLVEIPAGEYVRLSVRDTGSGMTEEIKNRVFEPFFTTKSKDKGTGLGLATSYGIIQDSKGYFLVDSEVGKGSTFEIILPAVEMNVDDASETENREMPPGSETILFAEDQKPVRDLIVRVLRGLGYTVLSAANGEEALTLAENSMDRRIDLLLTDVTMPVMGGVALAERMRHRDPDLKVIFISGHIEEKLSKDQMEGLKIFYLNKPFSNVTLACKIREVLNL